MSLFDKMETAMTRMSLVFITFIVLVGAVGADFELYDLVRNQRGLLTRTKRETSNDTQEPNVVECVNPCDSVSTTSPDSNHPDGSTAPGDDSNNPSQTPRDPNETNTPPGSDVTGGGSGSTPTPTDGGGGGDQEPTTPGDDTNNPSDTTRDPTPPGSDVTGGGSGSTPTPTDGGGGGDQEPTTPSDNNDPDRTTMPGDGSNNPSVTPRNPDAPTTPPGDGITPDSFTSTQPDGSTGNPNACNCITDEYNRRMSFLFMLLNNLDQRSSYTFSIAIYNAVDRNNVDELSANIRIILGMQPGDLMNALSYFQEQMSQQLVRHVRITIDLKRVLDGRVSTSPGVAVLHSRLPPSRKINQNNAILIVISGMLWVNPAVSGQSDDAFHERVQQSMHDRDETTFFLNVYTIITSLQLGVPNDVASPQIYRTIQRVTVHVWFARPVQLNEKTKDCDDSDDASDSDADDNDSNEGGEKGHSDEDSQESGGKHRPHSGEDSKHRKSGEHKSGEHKSREHKSREHKSREHKSREHKSREHKSKEHKSKEHRDRHHSHEEVKAKTKTKHPGVKSKLHKANSHANAKAKTAKNAKAKHPVGAKNKAHLKSKTNSHANNKN